MLSRLTRELTTLAIATCCVSSGVTQQGPRIVEKDGRFALMLDGSPFLILGGQINNSSAWPATLPDVWLFIEGMHANTVEAPVYWEQLEPRPGQFDFSNVDMLVTQAREHNVRLVLLWFGTFKNGEDHYVPEWIKTDPEHYPRIIDERGQPMRVLSPNSQANLDADKHAFVALTGHLAKIDGQQHTVIMIQVENESGSIGAVRDNSPMAQKEFEGQVPEVVLKSMRKPSGTWRQVFGFEADQYFEAYSVARYINTIAAAGKAELNIPMYCNVWVQYPRGYQIRGHLLPGFDYPSGGPAQPNIDLWKAVATSIDILGPDIYSADRGFEQELMDAYSRSDNPLWIPETGLGNDFAPEFFYALDKGAIGFSPFGIDQTRWTSEPGQLPKGHMENYALVGPIDRVIARANFEGKLKTAVEEDGRPEETLNFGKWQAFVGFGWPQRDGEAHAPGTPEHDGRALVAQIGNDDFLVTGVNARLTFQLAPGVPGQMQILKAEQGTYDGETWKPMRIWNGDQTDRGLNFKTTPQYVQIHLGIF